MKSHNMSRAVHSAKIIMQFNNRLGNVYPIRKHNKSCIILGTDQRIPKIADEHQLLLGLRATRPL